MNDEFKIVEKEDGWYMAWRHAKGHFTSFKKVEGLKMNTFLEFYFECYWMEQGRPRDRRFGTNRCAIISLEDYEKYIEERERIERKLESA